MHAEEVGTGARGDVDPFGNEGSVQIVGKACGRFPSSDVAESCNRKKALISISTNRMDPLQAAADPLNATKYAVGLPTPDCGNSEDANVPGPSTGGQGAEFRDDVAQSERFQVHH